MLNNNKILKLVESEYYEKSIDLIGDREGTSLHSLHDLISNITKLNPLTIEYFINKYTKKNDCILDPFCGFGTIALEAILKQRIAYASDIYNLAVKVTGAKLNPISFPELALELQLIDIKRLVRLGEYERYFSPFFDIDTYKEILAIREYIHENRNQVANFIEILMLGILHGPTSHFCSTPTYQEVSISPEKQHEINIKYKVQPEYRSVISRLLKKSSHVFEDLIPSFVSEISSKSKCCLQDARNLNNIPSNSVDLILTEPPLYYEDNLLKKCWLKHWFCNLNTPSNEYDFFDEVSWGDFINEALMEFARVLKPNKRIVFILKDSFKDKAMNSDKVLVDLINKQMSRYFIPEKCLTQEINVHSQELYKYLIIKKI